MRVLDAKARPGNGSLLDELRPDRAAFLTLLRQASRNDFEARRSINSLATPLNRAPASFHPRAARVQTPERNASSRNKQTHHLTNTQQHATREHGFGGGKPKCRRSLRGGGWRQLGSYYHQNAQGTTQALSNAAGTIDTSYRHDPFGKVRQNTGHPQNRITYTGQEHDQKTGLYYYGARYYDPDTGRFLNQDSYLGSPGTPPSLHRYLYAYSNPGRYVDPFGFANQEINHFGEFVVVGCKNSDLINPPSVCIPWDSAPSDGGPSASKQPKPEPPGPVTSGVQGGTITVHPGGTTGFVSGSSASEFSMEITAEDVTGRNDSLRRSIDPAAQVAGAYAQAALLKAGLGAAATVAGIGQFVTDTFRNPWQRVEQAAALAQRVYNDPLGYGSKALNAIPGVASISPTLDLHAALQSGDFQAAQSAFARLDAATESQVMGYAAPPVVNGGLGVAATGVRTGVGAAGRTIGNAWGGFLGGVEGRLAARTGRLTSSTPLTLAGDILAGLKGAGRKLLPAGPQVKGLLPPARGAGSLLDDIVDEANRVAAPNGVISDAQRATLRQNLPQVQRRSVPANQQLRREFESRQNALMREWTENTGVPWPTTAGGTRATPHHILPLESGGANAWWNLVPTFGRTPNHSLPGTPGPHAAGGVLRSTIQRGPKALPPGTVTDLRK